MTQKVLILGATGRCGAAVLTSFANAGWSVVAQSRAWSKQTKVPGKVELLSAQPNNIAAITAAAQGAQIVVHGWNPAYTHWGKELLPLAEQAMNIAQQFNALLIVPGNIYNFGSHMPPLLAETTPQRADTLKGALRMQMEAAIAKRCEHGLRAVVIRAGDFFGGAVKGSWLDLVIARDIAKGKLTYPGRSDINHAWAYLPDLAEATVKLATESLRAPNKNAFEVFHFQGHTATGQSFCNLIAKQMYKAPGKIKRMPWAVIQAGSFLVPMWREVAEMRYLWDVPHALDGTKLQERIGSPLHTPLTIALPQALKDLRLLSST